MARVGLQQALKAEIAVMNEAFILIYTAIMSPVQYFTSPVTWLFV